MQCTISAADLKAALQVDMAGNSLKTYASTFFATYLYHHSRCRLSSQEPTQESTVVMRCSQTETWTHQTIGATSLEN